MECLRCCDEIFIISHALERVLIAEEDFLSLSLSSSSGDDDDDLK
jgi:hypothetical protein